MKKTCFTSITIISLAVATTALAQDSDWTGFYAGGQLGTINLDSVVPLTDILSDADIIAAGFELDDTVDADADGTSYGLHAGYMYDAGVYVLGAEVAYDTFDFDEVSVTVDGTTTTETLDDDTDDTAMRLKFRAGYDAGQFLPYATAGFARLDSDDESTNGTFYGAGIAVLAADNIMIGGEILKHKFDDAFDSGFDFEATTISLSASYKF